MKNSNRPIIVGVSGATGSVYAIRTLDLLREAGVETHLVVSKAAEVTLYQETSLTSKDLRERATRSYPIGDIGAAISSGSFHTAGMIVVPCTVRTMAAIATGLSDNLLTRAADVTLKERRRLVLMLRETPLNHMHINAMKAVTEAGGIIAPPVPAFYNNPVSLDDIVHHSVARVLDLFDIELGDTVARWHGLRAARASEPAVD